MSTSKTNDPSEPGFDPLMPVVMKNGYTPRPKAEKQLPQILVGEWVPKFLNAYAESCNVSEACRQAGVSTALVYRKRRQDKEFADLWEEATQIAVEHVKAAAFDMALNGSEEPVFHMGEECGTKVRRHESMVQFLLKKHVPEVYGDKIEHALTVDAGVLVVPGMASAADWEANAKEQQAQHGSNAKRTIEHE